MGLLLASENLNLYGNVKIYGATTGILFKRTENKRTKYF
jgi:hypothetical protein